MNKYFNISVASEDFLGLDISDSSSEKQNTKALAEIINNALGEFTDQWFTEYSVMPSTLDLSIKRLKCFSVVYGSEKFKNDIEKYVQRIINVVLADGKTNWFHNPEMFLAPTCIDPVISFEGYHDLNQDYIDAIRTDLAEKDSHSEAKYKLIQDNLYSSAMLYPRTFADIFSYSASLYDAHKIYKGDEKVDHEKTNARLIEQYRNGVTEARAYYDYFIRKEGETYGYLTFPMVSNHARCAIPQQYEVAFGKNSMAHRFQGFGHCFIYFKLKNTISIEDFKEKMNSSVRLLVEKVTSLITRLAFNYAFNTGLILLNTAEKEAIKSAVSAIMSRNMSHNLGSHYLYYTKTQLDKLSSELDGWGPNVRGASKVLSYIQARMDYLATIISNDKYPYGAVNFKSQVFDELTVDKFSKRHFKYDKSRRTTNYLLANLIKSENFTIPDVLDNTTPDGYTRLDLCVKYYNEQTKKYEFFSGVDDNSDNELNVKHRLSNLYIALPGGIMSSHALFNVIENFIRNSAKYLQTDFQPTGLVFNILLKPSEDGRYIDLIIYDNKQNANRIINNPDGSKVAKTLYTGLLGKLEGLKIINESNEIEKDNKGFKEILFSSVWMKASEYVNSTYSNVIAAINSESNPQEKLSLIEKYGFSLVQVYDPFNEYKEIVEETTDKPKAFTSKLLSKLSLGKSKNEDSTHLTNVEDIVILERSDLEDNNRKGSISAYLDKANLGLKLTLPIFNETISFTTIPESEPDALKKNIESMLSVYSDIVCVDEEYYKEGNKISHCFTRPYSGTKTKPVEILREMLSERFEDFDKYQFIFDDKNEYNPYDKSIQTLNTYTFDERQKYETDRLSHRILFRRHLNAQEGVDFNNFANYAYVDSVSGGNFTITINDLILQGLTSSGYTDDDAEYFALKVKESALTRITIIDERLYSSMHGREAEYMVKNLRVINYNKLEDDISYAVNIVDNFVEKKITEEELKADIGVKLDEIAHCAAKSLKAFTNAEEIAKYLKGIEVKVSDFPSIEDFKKYLSREIVSRLYEIADGGIAILFEGNHFKDNKNKTHFMSIHLGLIEKILKNSEYINLVIDKRLGLTERKYKRLDEDRVIFFMQILKEFFDSPDLYISIHSGRGNFSKELEGPLAPYPFISLSALENAFNNSKYLLAQIFYNTVYIGKGLANS